MFIFIIYVCPSWSLFAWKYVDFTIIKLASLDFRSYLSVSIYMIPIFIFWTCFPSPFNSIPLFLTPVSIMLSSFLLLHVIIFLYHSCSCLMTLLDVELFSTYIISISLTHCPLEDVAVNPKIWYWNWSYRIVALALTVILLSGEWHRTSLKRNQHCSVDGLVPSGNKLSPETMFT